MTKKNVFITGAARGIGKAVRERFESAGFEVIAPDRSELDLSQMESVEAYLKRNSTLQVDVLINNAGENKVNALGKIELSEWQRILNVNLTSCFLLMQAFSVQMQERRWGRIVNISSCFSLVSKAGRAAYSTAKSGLNGLTRTAAIELAEASILVNSVCPGFVETDLTRQNNTPEQIKLLANQTPLKRLASPEEIAEFVYFLGSEKNTYLTGQSIAIDGGFTCL